jgi:hypothetical protein
MFINLKKLIVPAFALLILTSCNSEAAHHSHDKDSTAHVHTYACPMHPEVTGKEGDTCPKCGVKLEHSDASAAKGNYSMQFYSVPSSIQPNQDVKLSFIPKAAGSSEQVPLEVQHEKKIHLILVSDDLSWFNHIHPEYNADGSYSVNTSFPHPGSYKAFADFKPAGSAAIVEKIQVKVEGQAPAAKTFSGNKFTGSSVNYSFELKPTGGKLVTGALMHIAGIVKKDGKEIDANTLDNYLGAKAHFVVISLNEKEYLHVHPGVSDGQFDLHTNFSKPGIYRGWAQFNADGKIHTIDFTMDVAEGNADDVKKANQAHTDHHSGKGKEEADHNH